MDDGIVDIRKYLDPLLKGEGGAFSVWGGMGERARFALPVWRSVFLLGGDRGGIFHQEPDRKTEPRAFFVLDLAADPARTQFPCPPATLRTAERAPVLQRSAAGSVVVFLGADEGRRWYLEVSGGGIVDGIRGRKREELLFLAGECAGLLFLREFSKASS